MKKVGYLLALITGLFYGCSETEEINDQTTGKIYYPIAVGDYRIYNVTAVRYLADTVSDSSVFQLRERVDTLYNNLAGEPTYKIIRSRRNTANDAWLDDSVITITVSNNQVRRHANNQDLVKLVFPVKEKTTWNPNTFNTLEPGNAFYQEVGQPFSIDGQNFDKTTTVSVNDFVSVINKDVRKEVYAENIGLVYKNYEIIDFCNISDCDFDFNYILRGHRRIEVLDSYGKIE
jgi:hypothetical protein